MELDSVFIPFFKILSIIFRHANLEVLKLKLVEQEKVILIHLNVYDVSLSKITLNEPGIQTRILCFGTSLFL